MPTSPVADGVTFQPNLYYATTQRDNNPDCDNYNKVFEAAEFYSNDGVHVVIYCGRCGQLMEILTAALLDPQPEVM
ncbi:hypothetical protein [Streptomyces sp. NPDC088178]|uniref:hypothetical protein n=1 Tax=Streptomyces sp. NPDC088178 TaxID=3365836 RepID=UPI0037F32793